MPGFGQAVQEAVFGAMLHSRRITTFDGSAGNGAVGTVTLFPLTGRALVWAMSAYCTTDLVGAGALTVGVTGATSIFFQSLADATTWDATEWNEPAEGLATVYSRVYSDWHTAGVLQPAAIQSSIILTIATNAVTAGVVEWDVWYQPITRNGFLSGNA